MASEATYAKLEYSPKQFRPEDNTSVTFKLLYSEDYTMAGARGTLHIDGSLWDATSAEATQVLDTAIAGQHIAQWSVLSSDLANAYDPGSPSSVTSRVKAYVEIWRYNNGNIETIGRSNSIYVDLLLMWDGDSYFCAENGTSPVTSYSTTTSKCTIGIYYLPRADWGNEDDTSVQSYRIKLYDSNHKLIRDTGELYDWDANVYQRIIYTFYDLKDNTIYYVKYKLTLNGGYVINRGTPDNHDAYIPISVNYSDDPPVSNNFKLVSAPEGVKLSLDLTGVSHTKVLFTRTVDNSGEYLNIGTTVSRDTIITETDKYAIPTYHYTYKAVVYNGNSVVTTYYSRIQYISNCIKISDLFGNYTAIGNITKHPISRNDRGVTLETMDSEFPFHICNGKANYDSGSVDGIFSDVDEDCTIITDEQYLADKANILRAWLNNARAKLLTYYTGEAWIVSVNGVQTTDPDNNDVYHTTFNWTQIGNADRLTEYIRTGLVNNDD